MNKVATSLLAKSLMARALATQVRNGGTVGIYKGPKPSEDSPAPQLNLLCRCKVESCELLEGTVMRIVLSPTRVIQDGEPAWFRVANGSGEGLWDGKTGLEEKNPESNPGLIVPTLLFTKGARIEFDLFEHALVFPNE